MKLSVALFALLIGRFGVASTEEAGAWFTPIHRLSCRLRRKTSRRATAAAGRACRGEPWCRCTGCRRTAWNADEPWGPVNRVGRR
jgi:hypothetical protein